MSLFFHVTLLFTFALKLLCTKLTKQSHSRGLYITRHNPLNLFLIPSSEPCSLCHDLGLAGKF